MSQLWSNYHLINLQKYIISQYHNQTQDLRIEYTITVQAAQKKHCRTETENRTSHHRKWEMFKVLINMVIGVLGSGLLISSPEIEEARGEEGEITFIKHRGFVSRDALTANHVV